MLKCFSTIIIAFTIGACSSAKEYPVTRIMLPGNYSRLAACAYDRLSEESTIGIAHTEMTGTKTAEIKSGDGAVAFYEARFIGDGDMTRLEVKAIPSIRGATFYADKIRVAAVSCG